MKVDFCKLEVGVVRYTPMDSQAWFDELYTMSDIFGELSFTSVDTKEHSLKTSFTNEQLHCELSLVDSLDAASDAFTFSVWNVPPDVTIKAGDVLMLRFYWASAPTQLTQYQGYIDTVRMERSGADIKLEAKGTMMQQNILYNTSVAKLYPKLTYAHEIRDMIVNDVGLNFVSSLNIFDSPSIELKEPILTGAKTVGKILTEVCQQLGSYVEWKLVNTTDVYIYSLWDVELAAITSSTTPRNIFDVMSPKDFSTLVPKLKDPKKTSEFNLLIVDINDVFKLHDVDEYNIEMEVFGLPMIKAGGIFRLDCSAAPAYMKRETKNYVIDEIKHDITISSGFISTIYAHEVGYVNAEGEDESFDEY